MCCGWTPQVFIRDQQRPRSEVCPECGRRVPIKLIRVYHLVELDLNKAGKGIVAPSGKVVP
jgi:hypothetical protein